MAAISISEALYLKTCLKLSFKKIISFSMSFKVLKDCMVNEFKKTVYGHENFPELLSSVVCALLWLFAASGACNIICFFGKNWYIPIDDMCLFIKEVSTRSVRYSSSKKLNISFVSKKYQR